MMIKKRKYLMTSICSLLLAAFSGAGQPPRSPVSYVNPFIGASTSIDKAGASHGLGKTFPGAATPYGMVQLSPNTITGGDNGSGYSYEHGSIEGFAFTQLSGIGWYGDLGNFLVTPSSGPLHTSAGRPDHPEEGYRSAFDKKSESASPGYYKVLLSKYNVKAEMTAAPHSGMMRFSFPAGTNSRIQIDLARRVGGTSTEQYVRVVDDHTIEGWMKCTPDGGGWGNGEGHADYTVYFYAQFSKPLRQYGVWSADIPDDWSRKREDIESPRYQQRIAAAAVNGLTRQPHEQHGRHLGFYTEFATKDNEQVLMKTGISFTGMANARLNLLQEIKGWDFDALHLHARQSWDRALSKIKIEGGTDDEKSVFYTAMYHTMIDPRTLSDVDGSYPGGDGKIHGPMPGSLNKPARSRRTIFSGWDVFRSQMPLQTIINPALVDDLLSSLTDLADESGKHYFERWELMNAYSGCMIGNPAVSVLADAYAKGIRGYDVAKAYLYARNSCERFGNGEKGWSYACEPEDHRRNSYGNSPFPISNTLENAYSEWCLSRLAAALGKKDDEQKYAQRALSYQHVFDSSKHWFRPRREDGSWEDWPAEGRLTQFYGTVESNPYQQGWFVPHDIPGMVKLMGGKDSVIADLLNFFRGTPDNMLWNDYYNHANEPVHHVPFLFNRLGAPWLTQEWSRKICARAYHNDVEGLVGNEDVGQMSAWYVLAAAGIHPVCPGDTRYEITSPVFSRIDIQLDPHYAKGKTFTVLAKNNSPKNVYIQSARLNGLPYNKCWIDHADITAGGLLELVMGPSPNQHWGAESPDDLVGYANTLQGTASDFGLSYGNTYPTTALPFAMNAWSPQTGKNGDGWKYQYSATAIRGFGQTHQCSPWVNDYAVFSLMPVSGSLIVDENKRAAAFHHDNEIGRPDYYKVSFDNGICAEMSPTERGAHMRFTFPPSADGYIVLDGYTRLSGVHIDPEKRRISGWVNNARWTPANFRNYFVMDFDQPFTGFGTWENEHNTISKDSTDKEGRGAGAWLQFKPGTVIQVKIASSYISPQQALANLNRELGRYACFDDTRKAAQLVWNKLFHRVLVEGGTKEQTATFYSCLFRANLFSHQFFEYDSLGHPIYYSPYDGKIHDGYMYTDNGFWDTFRSQFPLNTILHPLMEGRYMQALLAAQQQCGWLPAWSFPSETGGMLGNHAISLLTDAWVKGIHSFNPDSALKAYYHEAANKGPWGGANGRQGWKDYFQLGYVPFPESQGSTAQTLEYAYDDFCGYQLAKMTGNNFYTGIFSRQMYNYKNVFDPATNFMRGRLSNGQWSPNFDPLDWGGPYTEGNAWHYTWSVFHDVQGLIDLMGGEKRFAAKIDSVFSLPNTIRTGSYGAVIHEMKEMQLAGMGQYAQGNQPIQHMIYLYNYARQPWKTQEHIRAVMDRLYNASEKGFPGDEDQGGMSSWYVLSALGIYSVCPGTDQYVIGSPLFPKATITMEDGKTFVIEAHNNGPRNVYISNASLNGKEYTHNWISHASIVNGGVLHFEMSDKPSLDRAVLDADKPFSLSAAPVTGNLQLASGLQDSMVIQQNHPFTVTGKADPGREISVQFDWLPSAITTTTDTGGNFLAIIPVPAVGHGDYRPHTITVHDGSSAITLHDVLIGEVWLCSGQSNMQFGMKEVLDSTNEIAAANFPNLRLLNVDLNFSAKPYEAFKGSWKACSPSTVKGFSAVGYYFGRTLQQTLDLPVGIIFSGIGASAAQAYVPESALAADTMLNRIYLQPYLNSPKSKEIINGGFSFEKVTRPFLLYNALIYPLRHLSIRGICWYQGESNRKERESFTRLTQTLIKSWRESFAQGELPFYYVQVAPFFLDKEDPTLADYAFFREAQDKVSSLNNTAMVTSIDVGEAKNLHPHNKKPIGIRLAKTALNRTYGLSDIVWRGPQFQHMEVSGQKATIFFEPGTTTGGLHTDDGANPSFFTIAGADQQFYPAEAIIEGDKIIAWSAKVKKPVAIRYAFTNYPVTTLHNEEGWPVVPFRTDSWTEPAPKTYE